MLERNVRWVITPGFVCKSDIVLLRSRTKTKSSRNTNFLETSNLQSTILMTKAAEHRHQVAVTEAAVRVVVEGVVVAVEDAAGEAAEGVVVMKLVIVPKRNVEATQIVNEVTTRR
jgi:hypothetical protein